MESEEQIRERETSDEEERKAAEYQRSLFEYTWRRETILANMEERVNALLHRYWQNEINVTAYMDASEALTREKETSIADLNARYPQGTLFLKDASGKHAKPHKPCVQCGKKVRIKGAYKDLDGNIVCRDCFNAHYFICPNCHEKHLKEEGTYTVDGLVCEGCLRYCYRKCPDCQTYHKSNAMMSIARSDGSRALICTTCHDAKYTRCLSCGRSHLKEDSSEVIGRGGRPIAVCPSCRSQANTCIHCERVYVGGNIAHIDDVGYVCGTCIAERPETYFRCYGCNGAHRNEDAVTLHYNNQDRSFCPSCSPEYRPPVVHDYHHKPDPIFHFAPSEPQNFSHIFKPGFIGVEVEVEGDKSNAEYIKTLSENETLFWLERDGSLNTGFEIVTHPATLKFHQEVFPWQALQDELKTYGYKSHDTSTCGLHVHISRAGLTKAQEIKIGLFCAFNAELLTKFGRRPYNNYCRQKNVTQGHLDQTNSNARDRYEAVNYENRNTIEFRFFKGSYQRLTVLGAIEFSNALAHFTRTAPFPTLVKPCWSDFCQFVDRHKGTYPNLLTYATSRDIFSPDAEPHATLRPIIY